MTRGELGAGKRVIAKIDGVDVVGFILEMRQGDKIAFVGRDDGEPSREVPVKDVRLKTGRPAGVGVRVPLTPPAAPFQRKVKTTIETCMEQQNLTWDSLAARAGLSRATIARVIRTNGEGQLVETMEAIARALGIVPSVFWAPADKAEPAR